MVLASLGTSRIRRFPLLFYFPLSRIGHPGRNDSESEFPISVFLSREGNLCYVWPTESASIVVATLAFAFVTCLAPAQVNVTTYHYDNARTGQNTRETTLTPANVNSNQFGKLFSVQVDGLLYAQPLYLSNVNIAGGAHNVLYVATEHDSVYAIDADSGTIYWQVSLIPAGGSTLNSSTDVGCAGIVPEVGITSTPVIDTATGTIYVLAQAKLNNSPVQYLHALDVVTHAEKFGGPTLIQATVPGTASGGTTVSFDAKHQYSGPACCW